MTRVEMADSADASRWASGEVLPRRRTEGRAARLVRSYLGRRVTVRIDRPLGSRHPEHGFEYPVNYGYVPGVLAPDGEELDAYVLGVSEPVVEFSGRCIAVLRRLDDEEDKLVFAPDGVDLCDGEILSQVHFQERFFHSLLLR